MNKKSLFSNKKSNTTSFIEKGMTATVLAFLPFAGGFGLTVQSSAGAAGISGSPISAVQTCNEAQAAQVLSRGQPGMRLVLLLL